MVLIHSFFIQAPPFHPTLDSFDSVTSLCDEDLELIKSIGFNSIRLSVPWAAVEPEEGMYNFTYLELMRDLVDRAGSIYGVYTLIDFHQDAWNAK